LGIKSMDFDGEVGFINSKTITISAAEVELAAVI
jgi:hypothetical protein